MLRGLVSASQVRTRAVDAAAGVVGQAEVCVEAQGVIEGAQRRAIAAQAIEGDAPVVTADGVFWLQTLRLVEGAQRLLIAGKTVKRRPAPIMRRSGVGV